MTQITSGGLSAGNNLSLASSRAEDMLSVGDTDGDGVLSLAEFTAMAPADAPKDGNGPSSEDLFNQADTDGDGSLTSDELTQFAQNAPARGPHGGGGMPPPPPSDEDEDDSSVSSTTDTASTILSQLLDELESDDTTSSTSTSTASLKDRLFSFFDTDGSNTVDDNELDNGVSALKAAMNNYLLSLQEKSSSATVS